MLDAIVILPIIYKNKNTESSFLTLSRWQIQKVDLPWSTLIVTLKTN